MLSVAIGLDGESASLWVPPGVPSDWDPDRLTIRIWKLESAYQEVGAPDLPSGLLAEFHEALWEDGRRGVRLLTAELDNEHGQPVIQAVSWYDSLEYEMQLSESDWDDDEKLGSPKE